MGITNSVMQTLRYGETDSNLDLAIGLTRRQKFVIKKSWSLMLSNQKRNPVALLVLLFARYPAQQDYFQLFRSARLEDLRASPVLRAHGMVAMVTIGSFVDKLGDAESLVGLVQKMAANHLRRGVPVQSSEDLRLLFGSYPEERLDEQATLEIKQSWDRFLVVVNALVQMEAKRLALMGMCVHIANVAHSLFITDTAECST